MVLPTNLWNHTENLNYELFVIGFFFLSYAFQPKEILYILVSHITFVHQINMNF